METLEQFASQQVGNWKKFDSYMDFSDNDPRYWALFGLSHRDSDILDQSNAAIITQELEQWADNGTNKPYDVQFGSASHWAVGYVDNVYIRVYDAQGNITDAFTKYHELRERMADYPVLDESDYSEREWKHAAEYWEFISKDEKKELKHKYGIKTRSNKFYSVMQEDNGGLYEYLARD